MTTQIAKPQTIALEFADHSLLPNLYGDHDRNLARIEQRLKVSLACFGNRIEISGQTEAAEAAHEALSALYGRLDSERESGRPGGVIDLPTVDAAISWVRGKGGGNAFANDASGIDTWKRAVRPRSPNQRVYIDALNRDELVFGLGPAGTGKTYMAVAVAVSMLKSRRVDRLILSRPAVEAGERIGFLPGDMKDKVDPYLRPLYDALYDMMPGEQVERRLASGEIEVAPLAFMRGRTLSNAYIILDEAQNTTPTQMKMFLTRLGENSRMTITGDLSQIDLPMGAKSGLREAIGLLRGVDGISQVEFTVADVVRHPLVAKIVRAYNDKEASLLTQGRPE